MKNLHIFKNDKFTEPFIKFINKNFELKEHLFLVWDNKSFYTKIIPRDNVIRISENVKSLIGLIFWMNKSEKIFLHGLFIPHLIFLLFLQPWLLKKCYWVVWGGDLYYFLYRKKHFKSNVYEFFRSFVIKRFKGLVTLTKGDYDLAKKWYGVKGKYYHGIYINPVKLDYLKNVTKNNDDIIRIQVGNSADSKNNHIEALNVLKKFKDKNIQIITPLSYGNRKYAEKIKKYGKCLFKDKFIPIMEFMKPDEYAKLLAKIDIAVFAHNRQQALGNIFALLYLGKKVYIKKDISTWKYLKHQLGFDVFNYDKISNIKYSDFIEIESNSIRNNKEKAKKIFDLTEIKKVWETIFLDEVV